MYGIELEVLDTHMGKKDLGSSPGHIVWTGTKLVADPDCPPDWVVHEAAHYLAASDRTRGLPNWGNELQSGTWETEFDMLLDEEETLACYYTVCMLQDMRYPWKQAALDLNLVPQSNMHHGDDLWDSFLQDMRDYRVLYEKAKAKTLGGEV